MKTKEELNALKEEVETLNKKLHELTDEELEQVSGGFTDNGDGTYSFREGDSFTYVSGNARRSFTVLGNYDHVSMYDNVYCEHFYEMNGTLHHTTQSMYTVQEVLHLY